MLIQLSREVAPGGRVMFSPVLEAPGTVRWRCETTQVEKKYLPALCRG
jgi:hypothetical protein